MTRQRAYAKDKNGKKGTMVVCLMCQVYFGGMWMEPPAGVAPTGATQNTLTGRDVFPRF